MNCYRKFCNSLLYEAIALIYKAVGYLPPTQISLRFHFEFVHYIIQYFSILVIKYNISVIKIFTQCISEYYSIIENYPLDCYYSIKRLFLYYKYTIFCGCSCEKMQRAVVVLVPLNFKRNRYLLILRRAQKLVGAENIPVWLGKPKISLKTL